MIAYRIEPGPVTPADNVVVVEAPEAFVLVITRDGTIVAADPTARRLLTALGGEQLGGLDGPIATAVQTWLGSLSPCDLIAMPLPGLVLRAIRLDDFNMVVVVLETV